MGWKAALAAAVLIASTDMVSAQSAAVSCALPEPIVKTFTFPPYPPASQRADESGTTMMMLTVAPDGTPTGAVVTRSSGARRLDDAATSFAVARYRWERAAEGCPASQQPMTVIWQLGNPPKADGAIQVPLSNYPANALDMEEMGDTYLTLSLGNGGAINDVRIVYSSGYPELDNQSIAIVKASPNLTAGKSSGAFTLLVRWQLPPAQNSKRISITSRAMHMQDAIRSGGR